MQKQAVVPFCIRVTQNEAQLLTVNLGLPQTPSRMAPVKAIQKPITTFKDINLNASDKNWPKPKKNLENNLP